MIQKIAWKNIWRNKLRSTVLICSIALGIWAGLFLMSMTTGLNTQRIGNAINSGLGHIQVHNPEYINEFNPKFGIEDTVAVMHAIHNIPDIKGWALHQNFTGMIASPTGGFGIAITGVTPRNEENVTSIATSIREGSYFGSDKKNQIVIGEKLANKLKVKLNNKVVITFQDQNDNIVSAAFKISGIYKTSSSRFDEANVFVSQLDLNNITGSSAGVNEIILFVDDVKDVPKAVASLKKQLPNLAVRSWDEISPELGYANEMMTIGLSIFIFIIILAMSFGIINTMLMAVLERQRELGMLLSVGMNKSKIFSMILSESVFISLIGGPAGILGALFTIRYFGIEGIDLSAIGSGLDSLGVGSVIYTRLDSQMYIIITITVLITSVLASVYPSLRAIRMNPAEVVRQN